MNPAKGNLMLYSRRALSCIPRDHCTKPFKSSFPDSSIGKVFNTLNEHFQDSSTLRYNTQDGYSVDGTTVMLGEQNLC